MTGTGKPIRYGTANDTLVNAYMAEVMKIPLLSADAERKVLEKARAGDRGALNDLVSANLRFVVAVCWNYRNRGLPMPDLINEGNLALFRAAENFAPGSTVRFISYAVWWIRQAILSAVARQSGTISLPPDGLHKTFRYRRIAIRLAQKLGREPVKEELDAEFGSNASTLATLAKVSECLSSAQSYGSEILLEGIPSPESLGTSDTEADLYLIRKSLRSRLRSLTPRQQRIISMRYGLWDGVRYSLNDVGAQLCLTRERVRQIEERALAQLRRSSRALMG